ncbi:hypothetical protein IAT40_005239 [Kwoniella sp. CBS 6097]
MSASTDHSLYGQPSQAGSGVSMAGPDLTANSAESIASAPSVAGPAVASTTPPTASPTPSIGSTGPVSLGPGLATSINSASATNHPPATANSPSNASAAAMNPLQNQPSAAVSTQSLGIHPATPRPGSPTTGPAMTSASHGQTTTTSPSGWQTTATTAPIQSRNQGGGPSVAQVTPHSQAKEKKIRPELSCTPHARTKFLLKAATIYGIVMTLTVGIITYRWKVESKSRTTTNVGSRNTTVTKTEYVVPVTIIPSVVRTALARQFQTGSDFSGTIEPDPDLSTDTGLISAFTAEFLNGDHPTITV